MELFHGILLKKIIRYERICSDHRDFMKCSKGTHTLLFDKALPYDYYKSWQKVFNIQRVDPLKYKEIKPISRLSIIHTFTLSSYVFIKL